MKQCMHKIETVKVPQGNAFGLLLPFKTARWENNELVPDNIDIRYLEDVVITIDGEPWTDYEMDERGPIVQIGAEDFNELGAYNAEITATYAGVAIRGAYYECFTRVEWSFESNVELHLPDSPLVAETSYVYIGITDDQELEALKQQYRNAIASCETARLQYEAAKEAYDEKAEALDDVAKQSTMLQEFALTLEAIAGIHIDIPENLATSDDVTAAKNAIIYAINNYDTSALAKQEQLLWLNQFLGITGSTSYTALTAAECIAIKRYDQVQVYGQDTIIPSWKPQGVTEAQVESAAEGLGITYYPPTQNA